VTAPRTSRVSAKTIGLFTGLALAVLIQLIPLPDGLSREAWLLASLAALMAAWWATEAIPIAATALIPMALFPLLGITTAGGAAAPYASTTVMLLLGGFIVAMTIERWNLHSRIALNVVSAFGGKPSMMIAGFMAASALLSMWISNTATTLMMIPIALKVAEEIQREGAGSKLFAPALALGVAYAASIGGVATPVGTPTNLIALEFMSREFDTPRMSFPEWMALGVPAALLVIPVGWFVLTKWAFHVKGEGNPAARDVVRDEIRALGSITKPEARAAMLFGVVALLWMGRVLPPELISWTGLWDGGNWGWNPLLAWVSEQAGLGITLAINDMQIAVMGALAAFLIPAGGHARGERLMDWETAARLPWNVIILFGGGISLAAALSSTGLADWLGNSMSFAAAWPPALLVLALVLFVLFLTELTSNVATISAFLPVMAALAAGAGVPPQQLIVPVTIAASCAFMLPVATAPNAIVYASGAVTQGQMIKAGVRLNLLAALAITAVGALIGPMLFGG
jgi:sodium-dependent dicarboxylate transporter 2/3/5